MPSALVRDPEVDAVYVATPPSTHCEYTVLAARAGKPVYVEKPMALDHGECRTMIDACAAAGVPLFTAYYRRAMPRFARIKALLDAGAIGTVRVAAVCVYRAFAPPPGALPWRIDPAISGGGLFVDLASHQLDLLDYFLGPITDVSGVAANQAAPLRRGGRRHGDVRLGLGRARHRRVELQRIGRRRSHRDRRDARPDPLHDVQRRAGGARDRRTASSRSTCPSPPTCSSR